jgi:hypothetical protein
MLFQNLQRKKRAKKKKKKPTITRLINNITKKKKKTPQTRAPFKHKLNPTIYQQEEDGTFTTQNPQK